MRLSCRPSLEHQMAHPNSLCLSRPARRPWSTSRMHHRSFSNSGMSNSQMLVGSNAASPTGRLRIAPPRVLSSGLEWQLCPLDTCAHPSIAQRAAIGLSNISRCQGDQSRSSCRHGQVPWQMLNSSGCQERGPAASACEERGLAVSSCEERDPAPSPCMESKNGGGTFWVPGTGTSRDLFGKAMAAAALITMAATASVPEASAGELDMVGPTGVALPEVTAPHLVEMQTVGSRVGPLNSRLPLEGSSRTAPPLQWSRTDQSGPALMAFIASSSTCEEPYGLLPCSTSVGGNLFLMLTFGYLLFTAAKLISDGSELLLEVLDPGLIGGLLLPILGALPDSLLILVAGLRGTAAEAQEEVMVGVGILAGSTIMILTIAWASSLVAGRCDLDGPNGTARDLTLTKGWDPFATGVTTDEQTRRGAWIMAATTIPFAIVQIPLLDGHPAEGPEAAAIGCAVAGLGLVAYCAYQVASPWLQQKKIEEARLNFVKTRALQAVSGRLSEVGQLGGLLQADGVSPDKQAIGKVFSFFDDDGSGYLDQAELRGLILGIGMEQEGYVPPDDVIRSWFSSFDSDSDGRVSKSEFVHGISGWAQTLASEKRTKGLMRLESSLAAAPNVSDFWAQKAESAQASLQLLLAEDGPELEETAEERDEAAGLDTPSQIYRQAGALLVLGTALIAVFADPMVDAIGGFSTATGIPPFFVAFVVTPFASNASELVSSIIFAMKKRKRNISLTFSQVSGAISMNNTLCLGIFLALVYFRHLTWDFSSEVTVILFTTFFMGALGGSRTTFPLWLAVPVLSLYPLSIATVAFLDSVLGWT